MKNKKIKFAGPSKKMRDALEREGLNVAWPEEVHDEEQLAFDGLFTTGNDWEKLVCIDLRNYVSLGYKAGCDNAIAAELQSAYDNFDVDEELKLNMQGTESERRARGVPDAARLLKDMQDEEKALERFAEVANAVAEGREIPPAEKEPKVGETIHITPQMAKDLVDYLKIAYPLMNNLAKSDFCGYINTLNDKLGIYERFNG